MHRRVDVDCFRAAEQTTRSGFCAAFGQAHVHPADLRMAVAAAAERQPVALADKLRHKGCGRTVVDFLRRGVLLDLAVVHHGDAVGHQHGFVLIVGNHQGGDAEVALQLAQFGAQMLADPGVQCRHRLIQQQQGRCRRQGPCQGDALLLAAGQLAREFLFAADQADQLQHLTDSLAHFVSTTAGEAVGNVRFDREIGE